MSVRRSPDAGRMAALVSRPGIDTRVWLTLATVTLVHVDPKHGVLVDLTLLPGGTPETAYMGVPYAGAGFGDHCPLEVDDTVLMAIPGGDTNNGPVIISRWHNTGDPPHPELSGAEGKSRVVRAKPGERIVIRTSLAGMVSVVAEGPADVELTSLGGLVQLGSPAPGTPASDFVALSALVLAELNKITAALTVLKAATATGLTGVPVAGSALGAAFTAATVAVPLPALPVAALKVRAT